MTEFPGNSNKIVEEVQEPPKVDKGITKIVNEGEVIKRKKSPGQKMKEIFIGGDPKTAAKDVFYNLLIPASKDMIVDAFIGVTERMFYGGDTRGPSRRYRGQGQNGRVAYNNFSQGSNRPPWEREEPRQMSRRARATHDFDDIVLTNRGEAEEVIDKMFEMVSKYEVVTVADLYEMVGITGNYTDNKWGWTDLRGLGATRVRGGGFLLDLPKPAPIQ